jgi:NifU-like protein involved in Fe-S cluster formation
MMGMELMLGKMIGKSPDDLKKTIAEFEAMIKGASEALISIAENQAKILAKLEVLENGPDA